MKLVVVSINPGLLEAWCIAQAYWIGGVQSTHTYACVHRCRIHCLPENCSLSGRVTACERYRATSPEWHVNKHVSTVHVHISRHTTELYKVQGTRYKVLPNIVSFSLQWLMAIH